MGFSRVALLWCAGVFFLSMQAMAAPEPERADDIAALSKKIERAYSDENKKAALWDLFYTEAGLDPVAYKMLIEGVKKMDLVTGPVAVLAEPLAPDEEVVERIDGYVYFQNLEPVGAVNIFNALNRKLVIRQYYGRHDGELFLTATIMEKEAAPPPTIRPDNWFFSRPRGQKKPPQAKSAAPAFSSSTVLEDR